MSTKILLAFLMIAFATTSIAQNNHTLNLSLTADSVYKKTTQNNFNKKLSSDSNYVDLQKMIVSTKNTHDIHLDYLFGKTGDGCVSKFCYSTIPIPIGYRQSFDGKTQFVAATNGGTTIVVVRWLF